MQNLVLSWLVDKHSEVKLFVNILFQYVKIARLTDAEDAELNCCMELGNEMEGVEEDGVNIQEVTRTVINYFVSCSCCSNTQHSGTSI